MRHSRGLLIAIVAVVAAACGGADSGGGGQSAPTVAEPTEAAGQPAPDDGGTTVAVTATDLGEILADGEDATLYLFLNDEQQASTCYDDCEQNWPPLIAPVEPGDGVDESLLGTVARDDGTEQVTYNDWPLYYFAGDAAAGDTAGQGVGEVWFTVDATGEPVKDKVGQSGQY